MNQEKGHQGKKPVLSMTAIINISSNGGSRRSGSSGSIRTIIMGKTITAVPVTSGISEKISSVV